MKKIIKIPRQDLTAANVRRSLFGKRRARVWRKVTGIEFAYDGEDFARDRVSVLVDFVEYKKPRFADYNKTIK